MPQMMMKHEEDPADTLLKSIGDLSGVELFNNQVLVAIYMRPEKTSSGLYLPEKNRDEDRYQSKIGLLIKKGDQAFVDPEKEWFSGADFSIGRDWLLFRPSDGWSVTINKMPCRIFDDISIKGRVLHPDFIW